MNPILFTITSTSVRTLTCITPLTIQEVEHGE